MKALIFQLRMHAVIMLLELALDIAPKENKQQGRLAVFVAQYLREQMSNEAA